MFKAAAVNGNVDILQYAVSSGHYLFPLVWIKKRKKREDYYEDDDDSYDDNDYYYGSVVCDSAEKESVDTCKIIERGHIPYTCFEIPERRTQSSLGTQKVLRTCNTTWTT